MRFLFPLLLLLVNCQATDPAMKLARSAATFVSVSDPLLRGLYEAEQEACLTQPRAQAWECVAQVRTRWAPVRAGLADIRISWCQFEPWKCQP